MFKQITFIIFFLFISATNSPGAVENAKTSDKLAVIINYSPEASPLDPYSTTSSGIAQALKNFSQYYLSHLGQKNQIFIKERLIDIKKYCERNIDSSFSRVIIVQPETSLETRLVTITDDKRRRKLSEVPGFLKLTLSYEIYSISSGKYQKTSEGTINEKAESKWVNYAGELSYRIQDSLNNFNPEPKNYIIERAITRLYSFIKPQIHKKAEFDKTRAINLYIDSSYIRNNGSDWELNLYTMIEYSSELLYHQFGTGLYINQIITINVDSSNILNMNSLFRLLKWKTDLSDDTINIFIFNRNDPWEYFFGANYDNIGIAELGKNNVIINEIPLPQKGKSEWSPYYSSLTLLHELGHILGAVHVSDINSIMSHQLTWMGSDNFDPFNRKIVVSALGCDLNFDDPVAYIAYVSALLTDISYYRVDYPQIFYEFISQANSAEARNRFYDAINRGSYLAAVKGYDFLRKGMKKQAIELFKQAIKTDPKQACLYYYLSLATEGEEAKQALEEAARLGYYLAQISLI